MELLGEEVSQLWGRKLPYIAGGTIQPLPLTNQPRTGWYYREEGAVLPLGQQYCRTSQWHCRIEETSRE